MLDLGGEEREIKGAAFGANMAIRRSAFDAVGPFSGAQPIYYDEVEWRVRLRRLGGAVVYVPDARVWHQRPPGDLRLRRLLARRYRFGYGFAAYQQSKGTPLRLRDTTGPIPRFLTHGLVHRCSFGLLATAEELRAHNGSSNH
jgi:GT2 family glycosyltransferase